MGDLRYDAGWQYHGVRVVRLENSRLLIDVMPDLGGRIFRWTDKRRDRDWLWRHPRIAPAILPAGSDYDANFSGGWDELFPCCCACSHAGEVYPDHGEYWTRPCAWQVHSKDGELTLHLQAEGTVTPTRMERWITLAAGSPTVRIRYRITHLGRYPFDYLWASHPALAIRPGDRLIIPAGAGRVASPGMGRVSSDAADFTWPMVTGADGRPVDLSRIPEEAGGAPGYEMVYLTELHAGWYALLRPEERCGFGLAFDPGVFRCLWLFQSLGGWRGLHVAVVEPATGYPIDLPEAAANGRCSRLRPGEVLETAVTAVVFDGRDAVGGIAPDGTVS